MKRILLCAFSILLVLCIFTGCGADKPGEKSAEADDIQAHEETIAEADGMQTHAEKVAELAKKVIPQKLEFDPSDYPDFENPPAREDILDDAFPSEFVFSEEEWTLYSDDINADHYTNDKNQRLTVYSDGRCGIRNGVAGGSYANYDPNGKLTGFHSDEYDYSETIMHRWDEAGEIEIPLTEIHVYGNPRYYYELDENGELLSTWVTATEKKNGAEIERRFIYDHTTNSLQECDIRYKKDGLNPYEIKGDYRGDKKLREVTYIRMDKNYVYRYDENFQFIEKDMAVYE